MRKPQATEKSGHLAFCEIDSSDAPRICKASRYAATIQHWPVLEITELFGAVFKQANSSTTFDMYMAVINK